MPKNIKGGKKFNKPKMVNDPPEIMDLNNFLQNYFSDHEDPDYLGSCGGSYPCQPEGDSDQSNLNRFTIASTEGYLSNAAGSSSVRPTPVPPPPPPRRDGPIPDIRTDRRAWFAHFDYDGDGSLNQDEVTRSLIKSLHLGIGGNGTSDFGPSDIVRLDEFKTLVASV